MTPPPNDGERRLRLEKSCPIPTTHTRLRHAHEQWHRTLAAYPDPDDFCFALNAAIETFRSVTNVLQKEKRAIPGFKDWYEGDDGWRSRMMADPRLKWLNDARVEIFHRGDLATHSTARVRITASWNGALDGVPGVSSRIPRGDRGELRPR